MKLIICYGCTVCWYFICGLLLSYFRDTYKRAGYLPIVNFVPHFWCPMKSKMFSSVCGLAPLSSWQVQDIKLVGFWKTLISNTQISAILFLENLNPYCRVFIQKFQSRRKSVSADFFGCCLNRGTLLLVPLVLYLLSPLVLRAVNALKWYNSSVCLCFYSYSLVSLCVPWLFHGIPRASKEISVCDLLIV